MAEIGEFAEGKGKGFSVVCRFLELYLSEAVNTCYFK